MGADGDDLAAALQRVKAAVEGLEGASGGGALYLDLARSLVAHKGQFEAVGPRHGPDAAGAVPRAVEPLRAALTELQGLVLEVEPEITPSRLPLLGRVLDLLRAPFHRLSLFYVHRLAAKQAAHNKQVGRVLETLATEIERLGNESGREGHSDRADG